MTTPPYGPEQGGYRPSDPYAQPIYYGPPTPQPGPFAATEQPHPPFEQAMGPSAMMAARPPSLQPRKRVPLVVAVLGVVTGVVAGSLITWAVVGSGKNSTSAASGSANSAPSVAGVPNSGTPGATAPNAVDVPQRREITPAHDGKTGLVSGPSFAPQDGVKLINFPDVPFQFDVPAAWDCAPSVSANLKGDWTCQDTSKADNPPGGVLMIKQCAAACGESERASDRNDIAIAPNLWRQIDPNTYFADLARVENGLQMVRLSMAYFFAANPGGPLDTAAMFVATGPVDAEPDLQKIVNEIRERAAG